MNIISIPGFSEPFSAMSHLFATAPFTVWGIALLVRAGGGARRWFWLLIFVLATLTMLSLSGVYHLLNIGGTARVVLQRLDHAAIFFLIAGTFTAAHGILFRGIWRWGFLLLIWGLSILSITLKSVFFDDLSPGIGLGMYLGLGWLGAVSGTALIRRYGLYFARWLIWGALAYSAGAVAEYLQTPVLISGVLGPHEIFHLAVLFGLFCHWLFIWQFADGTLPVNPRGGTMLATPLTPNEIEARMRAAVPQADWFQYRVESAGGGRAVLHLKYHDKLLRPGGTISGPALMTLADTAMYAVMFAELNSAEMAVTTDLNFHFLRRPAPADVIAEAELLKLGSKLAVCSVCMRSAADGALVAHATGTYALPPTHERG
ncbi:MAG: PAQR family membrane homeostasis protein TrhA [Nevskiales bacterium]